MLRNPEAVFATDVDGDGDEDLIGVGIYEAVLYLNDGSGNYSVGSNIGGLIGGLVTGHIHCATLLDGNGDGLQDLAVGYELPPTGHYIGWCKGNGTGFDPVQALNTIGLSFGPNAMGKGDILGSPADELVVAMPHFGSTSSERLRIYDLDLPGSATWALYMQDFATFGGYHSLEVLDINGDGQNEIIATAASEKAIKMIRYLGGGLFDASVELLSNTDVGSTHAPLLTRSIDWNGDGLMDLFWSDLDQLSININNGSGFDPPIAIVPSPSADSRYSNILPFDVDGDGDEDLILQRSEDNYLNWLERTPSGTGSLSPIDDDLKNRYSGSVSPLDNTLRIADIDGDGINDLIAVGQEESVLAYYPGEASGFGPRQLLDPLSNSLFRIPSQWTAMGDFDGDGDRDLLLMPQTTSHATVAYENTGMGWSRRIMSLGGTFFPDNAFADLDNDGLLDLAYNLGIEIGYLRNNGDWTVDTVPLLLDVPGSMIHSGDLNADGFVDLALQRVIGGSLRVFKLFNDGSGGFVGRVDYGFSSSALLRGLGMIDLNGDGAAEFFGANRSVLDPALLHVLPNQGNGNSRPEILLPATTGTTRFVTPIQVEAGRKSLLAVHSEDRIVLFRQNPNGAFSNPIAIHTTPSTVTALAASDLNGNGVEDILYGTDDGKVRWIESALTGGSVRTLDVLPYSVDFVDTEDVNGDGKPDVVAVAQNYDRREMRWYANALPSVKTATAAEQACTTLGTNQWSMPTTSLLAGEPTTAGMQHRFRLVDAQGRVVQQGMYTGQAIALPGSLPGVSYWLLYDDGRKCRLQVH